MKFVLLLMCSVLCSKYKPCYQFENSASDKVEMCFVDTQSLYYDLWVALFHRCRNILKQIVITCPVLIIPVPKSRFLLPLHVYPPCIVGQYLVVSTVPFTIALPPPFSCLVPVPSRSFRSLLSSLCVFYYLVAAKNLYPFIATDFAGRAKPPCLTVERKPCSISAYYLTLREHTSSRAGPRGRRASQQTNGTAILKRASGHCPDGTGSVDTNSVTYLWLRGSALSRWPGCGARGLSFWWKASKFIMHDLWFMTYHSGL